MDLESPPAATSGRSSPHHRQPTTAVVFLSSATSSSQSSSSISSQSATSGTWSQDRERAAGRNQLFNPAFNWTVETPKPVSTTTFVDCGQNKSTGTTISQPRSEAASPSSSSGTSPPPPKIRRMQVGITQQSTSTTSGRSVGQRIKEASLKDAITTHQHGATTPSSATVTPRTSRTTISTCEQVVQPEPIALNEIQKNTLRVIGQYLRDLGMNDTVEALVEESGCRLENSLAVRLREYVHHGNWNKALDVVEKIRSFIDQTSYITLRVVLLEEKLKELLAYGEKLMALRLLQVDYPKIEMFANRRKYYATLLMEDTHLLMNKFYANKQGNKSNAMVMAIVQKIVPPSFMLPPARLEELLNQAWLYQMSNCKLHVMPQKGRVDETCILKDHECGSAEFPTKNIQVLHDHCAEVWCLEFSPCGRYLASGAKSNCVHIWKVDNSQRVSIYRRLQILQDITGVSSISWSQDSQFLTVSTPEENNTGVFVFDVRKGTLEREFKFYGQDTFSVASFFKDQSHKFAAGDQKGHFSYYDLDRDLPHNDAAHGNFEGYRVRALCCLKDGKSVLAADTHNRIRRYDFESHYDETIIQEMSPIMYFTVDRAEKQCLVTTKTEGIRLWCLKSQTLLQSFFGALHGEFVISACFGGFYDNFIASGSEDDNVVIWNTKRSSPIKYLQGHTGTVNAVSWNPVHLCMLASGSDDGTIRIWSTNSPKEIE